jgi:hypothetical protein
MPPMIGPTSEPTSWPVEGIAEPVFRHLARHQRDRGAGKPGEDPHEGAEREELPDIAGGAHQRGEQPDRQARPEQHQFAAVAVGDLAP